MKCSGIPIPSSIKQNILEVVFHTTSELDQFIGQLQHFGRTKTQIVFSTSVEHRGIPLGDTRIPILEQEEEKG